MGSIIGYSAMMSIAQGIKQANGVSTDKLIAAFKGLKVTTPFGPITYRAQDHQSTMGSFVGRTKNEAGKGIMVDFAYAEGASYLPSDADVNQLRPAH